MRLPTVAQLTFLGRLILQPPCTFISSALLILKLFPDKGQYFASVSIQVKVETVKVALFVPWASLIGLYLCL